MFKVYVNKVFFLLNFYKVSLLSVVVIIVQFNIKLKDWLWDILIAIKLSRSKQLWTASNITLLNTQALIGKLLWYFCCRAAGVDFGSLVYEKPYCRIAPYLVGVVLGYLLIQSKDWRLPTKVKALLTFFVLSTSVVKWQTIEQTD